MKPASEVWANFEKRVSALTGAEPDKLKEKSTLDRRLGRTEFNLEAFNKKFPNDPRERKFSEKRLTRAVTTLQQAWKHKPPLQQVNIDGIHPTDFKFFGQTRSEDKGSHSKGNPTPPKKLIKEKLIKELTVALQSTRFDMKIFNHPDINYAIVSLYASNHINLRQASHLLLLSHWHQAFPEIQILSPLDNEGNFTPVMNDRYLPSLKSKLKHEFNIEEHAIDQAIENYRLLLNELPLYERLIFSLKKADLGKRGYPSDMLQRGIGEHYAIEVALLFQDPLAKPLVFMNSYSNFLALGLALFGENDFAAPIGRIGEQGRDEIEFATQLGFRLFNLSLTPNIIQVHNQAANVHEAAMHDFYHAISASMASLKLRTLFLETANQLRRATGIKWSKEIWDCVDQDLFDLRSSHVNEQSPIHLSTEFYCQFLETFLPEKSSLFTILIDYHFHPEKYNHLVSHEALPSHFKWYLEQISLISDELRNKPATIQLLKFFLKLSSDRFPELNTYIDQHQSEIEEQLAFDKIIPHSTFFRLKQHNQYSLYLRFGEHKIYYPEDAFSALEHFQSQQPNPPASASSSNKI